MEKKFYSAASLDRGCVAFERQYGLSSEEFYAAYTSGEHGLDEVPRFHRHLWASFYRGSRSADEAFVSQIEQTLALA